MCMPTRFSLGHVVATPGVLDRVSHGLVRFLGTLDEAELAVG